MTRPTVLNPAAEPDAIDRAADRLAAGHLLALPTETVYGLGARADADEAVAQIFQAKGRPVDHPLIVHVHSIEAAAHFAQSLPQAARTLMQRFWPGPLTVIVPRRAGVGRACAGGHDTLGLRCPDHPVALALLKAAWARGVPGVAAPSANRFGRISPTRADHVVQEFPDLGLWVLDGGVCEVGIESTIVDCSRDRPTLLRPGRITLDDLREALGAPVAWSRPEAPDPQAPRASGTLLAHYAPRARVRLMDAAGLDAALRGGAFQAPAFPAGAAEAPRLAVYRRTFGTEPSAVCGVAVRPMPTSPQAAAHELFAALRDFDALGVEEIWVECPPEGPSWEGVRDRLRRAAASG